MKNLLLVIDYQYDFVDPKGELPLPNASTIDGALAKYVKNSKAVGDDVIYTLDTHDGLNWHNHPESKLFPLHCDGAGATTYKMTGQALRTNGKAIEKQSYCLPNDMITVLLKEYDNITFCGVATDICVLQNAIAFYNSNFYNGTGTTLKLADEYCAGTTKENHDFAVNYMLNTLGFKRV